MKKSREEIKLVQDWLKFARENLLLARSGMEKDYAPYHTICFLCQGSTEKYLKAFLIWNGWELRKIHDLLDLLGAYASHNENFVHTWALKEPVVRSQEPEENANYRLLNSDSWLLTPFLELGFQVHLVSFLYRL